MIVELEQLKKDLGSFGRRLVLSGSLVPVAFFLAACTEKVSSTVATEDLTPRNFFGGALIAEGNRLDVIIVCNETNSRLIKVLDYSRNVVVLEDGGEIPFNSAHRNVVHILGDPYTNISIVGAFQNETTLAQLDYPQNPFITEEGGFLPNSPYTKFQAAVFPTNLIFNTALEDKTLEDVLIDELPGQCYR